MLKPHTLLFIPPNTPQAITSALTEEYERYILHFDENVLSLERRGLLADNFPTLPANPHEPLPDDAYLRTGM